MSDLIRVRAHNGNGITWSLVGSEFADQIVELDTPPVQKIHDGDVYEVQVVKTKKERRKQLVVVKLIAKVQELAKWATITQLDDFFIGHEDLQSMLILLHSGIDLILVGDKGTGKTTLGFSVARALGWQDPLKVDVGMIKRAADLFGSDAAKSGSTFFARSPLFSYIERAVIAAEKGLQAQFIVILDEINRVHAKSVEGLHGLFDDTRQITIPTSEGGKIITLPGNVHFIGTMNQGANYHGTFELDDAIKDRFISFKMKPMALDFEVNRLQQECAISASQALEVVQIARALREAAAANQIGFAPSYRACRAVAYLLSQGIDLKTAAIKGFLGWYQGDLDLGADGQPKDSNSEIARAYAALRMRGVAKPVHSKKK